MSAGLATRRSTSGDADARAVLRLWLRLLSTTNLIEQRVRAGLRAQFNSTLPRFDLLAQLDHAPQGLTMGELSRRMMVTSGNVTGLAARLIREGLVERRVDTEDRRSATLRLTAAGRRAFGQMAPVHAGWIAEVFKELDAGERDRLGALLGQVKQSLGSTDNAQGRME
jgi:DNA-binding MarR family transcriptional regulator